MKILDTELEFDFFDADCMERLENAMEKMTIAFEKVRISGEKASQVIRELCEVVYKCFDEIFGEGMALKIFDGRMSFTKCIDAYEDLCIAKDKCDADFIGRVDSIVNKYSPDRASRG